MTGRPQRVRCTGDGGPEDAGCADGADGGAGGGCWSGTASLGLGGGLLNEELGTLTVEAGCPPVGWLLAVGCCSATPGQGLMCLLLRRSWLPPSVCRRYERGATWRMISAGCDHPLSLSFFKRTGEPGWSSGRG